MTPAERRHALIEAGAYRHPTGNLPKRVCLIALGASATEILNHRMPKGRATEGPHSHGYFDEHWTINRGIKLWPHDVVFALDDFRIEKQGDPEYARYLEASEKPIITSTCYPEVSAHHAYPLLEIAQAVGPANCYFHNSVPLILAYAWWLGVEELALYGCDYRHPGQLAIEENRANAEYWVGFLRAQGVHIAITSESALCNTRLGGQRKLYGWLVPPYEYTEFVHNA